jgi:hypothetical protein
MIQGKIFWSKAEIEQRFNDITNNREPIKLNKKISVTLTYADWNTISAALGEYASILLVNNVPVKIVDGYVELEHEIDSQIR